MNKEKVVRKEPVDVELSRQFVMAAHQDLEEVKRLYNADPDLLHAVVNWGGDDWEGALGAAAHTGRRDIAEFLLSEGARMDLFSAAMLGNLPIVKEILRIQPQALQSKGPHGIPLMHHARMGGEQARHVFEYLMGLNETEVVAK